jgi:phage-related protein
MATFPDIAADYDARKSSQPRTRVVQFGDGYEQRLSYGLNQNPKEWSLTFKNRTEADSDTIETFLDARAADGESFDWTPPGSTTSYKWVCPSWSKTIPAAGLATITATFRQVFEP